MSEEVDDKNADELGAMVTDGDPVPEATKWYQKRRWQIGGAVLAIVVIWASANQEEASEAAPTDEVAAETNDDDQADADQAGEVQADETEAASAPLPALYDFEVISQTDVSFANATRLAVAIEIREFPIERARLDLTLAAVAESFRGDAHAVSVQVHYDRRESVPGAYGVYSWAPGGVWGDADQGDKSDWDGYEFSANSEPGKIDTPTDCSPPSDDELAAIGAFWDRRASEPDEVEDEALVVAAEQVGMTADDLRSTLSAGIVWNYC